jgi:FtsP/CotA-like multicopper oxidase with cupredoxin domain
MIRFLHPQKHKPNSVLFQSRFGVGKLVLAALLVAGAGYAQRQPQIRREDSATAAKIAASPQTSEICSRFPAGSVLSAPEDLRSQNGVLKVQLSMRSFFVDGEMRYCYVNADGNQSPTLRLRPGDLLVLSLKNELSVTSAPLSSAHRHTGAKASCGSGTMTAAATNFHFHGLYLPPLCHQDETLNTLIQPSDPAFEYQVRIPRNQPPGLYWYHPHPHGFSETQVLGGASGALIVEGIERVNPLVAGLPERVLVIRDQRIPASTTIVPSEESAFLPEKPSKDLSINFIPVVYPKYPPAIIRVKPSERQLWRVLNASADTTLDLQVLFGHKAQTLGVVALDGVPVARTIWQSDIPIPAGGRAEFIVNEPPENVPATLVTLGVETAPFVDGEDVLPPPGSTGSSAVPDDDDNTPPRPLATIVASAAGDDTTSKLPLASTPLDLGKLPSLTSVKAVRHRKLYFSEKVLDPKHPSASTIFFITEEGQTPAAFDPASDTPNITVHQGDVEDWTIENRTQELHTFHIHQTHFVILEHNGIAVDEPNLRDTIGVGFWDGNSPQYPSVKLRMDFRDPNILGTFPYHCHILQHEDGGMMGTIQVLPASKSTR